MKKLDGLDSARVLRIAGVAVLWVGLAGCVTYTEDQTSTAGPLEPGTMTLDEFPVDAGGMVDPFDGACERLVDCLCEGFLDEHDHAVCVQAVSSYTATLTERECHSIIEDDYPGCLVVDGAPIMGIVHPSAAP